MRRRPAASALRRRFNAMAIVAAIAVFSVLAGTGASYAYWSANASRTVNATTGNVQVTVSGFTAGQIQNHVKQTVGYVTVTNTTVQNASSTTPATLSLTVGAGGGNAFAAAAGVVVWPAAGNSSANCTLTATTPGSQSGSWSPGVTITGSLAKGASVIYCVRTTVANPVDAGSASGTTSFAATVSATLSVHNFTGTASMAPTMSTAYVYPLGTPITGSYLPIKVAGTELCVDVEGGNSSGAGSEVIPWGCHGGDNQQWRMTATASGYYELNPLSSTTLRITAASTASGSAVTVQNDNGTSSQDWQVQVISGTQFQLVNRQTGYCLTSSSVSASSNDPTTQAPCAGTANQRFQSGALANPLTSFSCTRSGTGNNRNLVLSWAARTGTFRLVLNSTLVATQTGTLTGMTHTINQNSFQVGTYPYAVQDGDGSAIASGTFTITEEGWFLDPKRRLTGCTP